MPLNFSDLAYPTDPQALTLRVYDTLRLILDTGDVVGHDHEGRTLIQLSIDEIQLDELAAFGAELEDLELEVIEDDLAL